MVSKLRMPKIDANVTEGAIGQWLVNQGQWVEVGQGLVEIITDKATFEFEAEQPAFLRRRVAQEKSVVPIGFILALLSESEDEPLPDVTAENAEIMQRYLDAMLAGALPESEGVTPPQRSLEPTSERVRATPAARHLARQHGVPLQEVMPAGNVIEAADVRRHTSDSEGGQDAG